MQTLIRVCTPPRTTGRSYRKPYTPRENETRKKQENSLPIKYRDALFIFRVQKVHILISARTIPDMKNDNI